MSAGMLPGWGNVPCAPAKNLLTRDWRFERLPGIEEAAPLLAVGMRRSYGDVCVNEESMTGHEAYEKWTLNK